MASRVGCATACHPSGGTLPRRSPSILWGLSGCLHWMAGCAGEQAGGHQSEVRIRIHTPPCTPMLTPGRREVDGSESLVDGTPLDTGALQVPSAQILAKALLAVAAPAMAAKAGVCARMMLAAHHGCVVPGHQKDSVWKVGTLLLLPAADCLLALGSHVRLCGRCRP